jgi:Tfp pilus assembly protein PilO
MAKREKDPNKKKGRFKRLVDKVVSYLSGDKLIEWGVDRQLGFIFYIFLIICASIAWSLMVEQDLVKVQKNEKALQELRISYQQRTLDLVGMNNRTRIDGLLKASGSKLHAPVEPPKRIELEK